jgi:CPA1 family monovalent cation:H+ antiporter
MPRRWLENPSIFHLIAGLISLAAGAAYLNYRLLRLPPAIGMMLIVLAASVALVLLRAAGEHPSAAEISVFLAREAGGALLFGALLGLAAVRLLSGIDDYSVEILMTLAVAMGGYAAAEALHVSAPITVAVTGLLIGNRGRGRAMTEQTRRRLDQVWELVDYLLTSLLFVMIALEIFTLEWSEATAAVAWLAAASVLIALAARLASVALPLAALAFRRRFAPGTLALLTWGGLKGGVSIALALSLPASGPRELLLALTYAVAVFSIVIQGLTLRQVAERLVRKG